MVPVGRMCEPKVVSLMEHTEGVIMIILTNIVSRTVTPEGRDMNIPLASAVYLQCSTLLP